jgi:tetratricopeptide (TPR) repeat protein
MLYLIAVTNKKTRVWFAHLTRPLVAEQLIDAQLQWKIDPQSAHNNARLSLLYERAGLRAQARSLARRLRSLYPQSIYTAFVDAMLAYRSRRYAVARNRFVFASDCPLVDPPLKGALLAAAACAAFAEGDCEGALNLSERALEFDDASLVARMVKVDVFLRTGRKDQAGDEIVSALRRGLDIDLDNKIPLDGDIVLQRIARLYAGERIRRPVGSRQ